MSNIVDRVFAEVCLDERITDGIFKMDEEQHMNALRDYFVKKGITKEAAVQVTNRMVEGKYPDRQAWRVEDGILVTWPSPKHKAKAMQENPRKYTDKDPAPGTSEPPKRPEPTDRPETPEDDKVTDQEPEKKEPNIFQGNDKLEVEPPRGDAKAEPLPVAKSPVAPPVPRTPERVAAEKEVVKQIFATDDSALTKIEPQLNEGGNPEVENKIRVMRSTLVSLIDSLTFEQLSEAYSLLVTKYLKP